jgi:hypothetical protein
MCRGSENEFYACAAAESTVAESAAKSDGVRAAAQHFECGGICRDIREIDAGF